MKRKAVGAKGRARHWHTRKWYKENLGVDPLEMRLPFTEVPPPIRLTAAPLKLWEETEVFPFRNEDGIKEYAKRKEAGQRVFTIAKNTLKEGFNAAKSDNPRVKEIFETLYEIEVDIIELCLLKDECSENDSDYDKRGLREFGIEHCPECEKVSRVQNKLREEREQLFLELEEICKSKIRTIYLA